MCVLATSSSQDTFTLCLIFRLLSQDGIGAAVAAAQLALMAAQKGWTLVDQLNAIYEHYGFHANYNSYFICR
jgi:hypothetical protein